MESQPITEPSPDFFDSNFDVFLAIGEVLKGRKISETESAKTQEQIEQFANELNGRESNVYKKN